MMLFSISVRKCDHCICLNSKETKPIFQTNIHQLNAQYTMILLLHNQLNILHVKFQYISVTGNYATVTNSLYNRWGAYMDIELSDRSPVQRNYVSIPRPLYQEVKSYIEDLMKKTVHHQISIIVFVAGSVCSEEGWHSSPVCELSRMKSSHRS